eukprot:scaffold704_cov347-Prasinococcus_capsulatus_cf.AAC.20
MVRRSCQLHHESEAYTSTKAQENVLCMLADGGVYSGAHRRSKRSPMDDSAAAGQRQVVKSGVGPPPTGRSDPRAEQSSPASAASANLLRPHLARTWAGRGMRPRHNTRSAAARRRGAKSSREGRVPGSPTGQPRSWAGAADRGPFGVRCYSLQTPSRGMIRLERKGPQPSPVRIDVHGISAAVRTSSVAAAAAAAAATCAESPSVATDVDAPPASDVHLLECARAGGRPRARVSTARERWIGGWPPGWNPHGDALCISRA